MAVKALETIPLGTLLTRSQYGLSVQTSQEGNVAMFKMNNFENGYMSNVGVDFALLSENEISQYELKGGDILFNRTNSPALVGKAGIFNLKGRYVFASYLVRLEVDRDKVNPYFLNFFLNSGGAKAKLRALTTKGVSQANINPTQLKKLLKVPLLPLPEQTKIAKVLLSWDMAIATTEHLITNSQRQKKALTQQLLTGKKRFLGFVAEQGFQKTRYGLIPTDWRFVAIGVIAKQITKKNSGGHDLPVLSCSKHVGFVDSLKYFKKKVYSDDTSNYNVIERGCFGFPSNHIEEGSIGYQNCYAAGIVSPIYTVFKANKQIDDGYLYRLLKTDHYRQIFAAATNASVDRRGSLRWKEFSKIRVPLPTLAEQQKISSVLGVCDREIEFLQESLERLTQEKKALMQQLLTGKKRVSIEKQ